MQSVERGVGRRVALGVLDQLPDRGRAAIAPADEAHAHAHAGHVGELAPDRLGEQVEQAAHLVVGPVPVLGREREDGQRVDTQVEAGLDGPPQRSRAGAVAGQHRQPARARPAGVAVHDDRDGARDLGQGGLDGPLRPGEQAQALAGRPAWRLRDLSAVTASHLDLEDLGFLVLQHVVDALHVLVGELLHALLGAVDVVGLRLAVLRRDP